MTRTLPEWVGKTDDEAIPTRVKVRVFDGQHKRCAICERLIYGNEQPEFDHTIALINGGENRESNVRALCRFCHGRKTREDVAQKAKNARVRAKHIGVKQAKRNKLPGSKGSGWRKPINGPAYKVKEE